MIIRFVPKSKDVEGGDLRTTMGEVFKLVEIFVVESLQCENVVRFIRFGYFTP